MDNIRTKLERMKWACAYLGLGVQDAKTFVEANPGWRPTGRPSPRIRRITRVEFTEYAGDVREGTLGKWWTDDGSGPWTWMPADECPLVGVKRAFTKSISRFLVEMPDGRYFYAQLMWN